MIKYDSALISSNRYETGLRRWSTYSLWQWLKKAAPSQKSSTKHTHNIHTRSQIVCVTGRKESRLAVGERRNDLLILIEVDDRLSWVPTRLKTESLDPWGFKLQGCTLCLSPSFCRCGNRWLSWFCPMLSPVSRLLPEGGHRCDGWRSTVAGMVEPVVACFWLLWTLAASLTKGKVESPEDANKCVIRGYYVNEQNSGFRFGAADICQLRICINRKELLRCGVMRLEFHTT